MGRWRALQNLASHARIATSLPAIAAPAVAARLRDEVLAWSAGLPEGPWSPSAGSNAYPWPRPKA